MPTTAEILDQVLARVRATPGAVVVFDLDSTLFDNRPRQARILREYGEDHGIEALQRVVSGHFDSGWDLNKAMLAAGLPAGQVEAISAKVKEFWRHRFFTSPYCLEDASIRGAQDFVHAVLEAGGFVAYCTGRHEEMRMGSVGALAREGFPVPGEPRVRLVMKEHLALGDDEFKCVAHAELRGLGTVVAAFDNEPTHINDYHRVFAGALAVHLQTDHSGRPVAVADGIVGIPDFVR